MFCVSCSGIWWCYEVWISEMLKSDYLKNEKSFQSEIKNIFLVSKVLSFRHTKPTSKNVVDTTFKPGNWVESERTFTKSDLHLFCRVAIIHHLLIQSGENWNHITRHKKFKFKPANRNLMQSSWICQTLQYLMIMTRMMKFLYWVINVMIMCQKLRKESMERSQKVEMVICPCPRDTVTLDQGRVKFARKYTPLCISCLLSITCLSSE